MTEITIIERPSFRIGRKWRKRRRLAVARYKDKHVHTTRGGRGEFARLRRR